jgi:hypothetical protein
MSYGEVLSKAWHIIWKHKVLWIFGILAGCAGGGGGIGYRGGGSSGSTSSFRPSSGQFDFSQFPEIGRFFSQVGQIFQQIPLWVYLLSVLILILIIGVFVFLGTMGRIGLIRGAWQCDEYDEKELSFVPLFEDSLDYFWRVFLLSILVGVAILIVLAIIFIPLILFGVVTLGLGMLLMIPVICLLVPALWVIGVVTQQAEIAIVGEKKGIFSSLSRGWEVVRPHLGVFIVMALILWLGSGIAGFVLALPGFLIILPLLGGLISGNSTLLTTGVSVTVISLIIYIPIALVLSGIIRAYITAAWTITYRRLTIIPEEKMPPEGTPLPGIPG